MTEQEYIKKITYLERQITSKDGIISEAIKMMDTFNAQIESLIKKVALLEKRLAAAEQNNIHKNSDRKTKKLEYDLDKLLLQKLNRSDFKNTEIVRKSLNKKEIHSLLFFIMKLALFIIRMLNVPLEMLKLK